MAVFQSFRFSVYAALLLVSIVVVQLAASLMFYRAIDEQTLVQDHARRVAELLVVSDRVFRSQGPAVASVMSSEHLMVTVTTTPVIDGRATSDKLRLIGRQIITWEPSLSGRPIKLAIQKTGGGRRDLLGSMQLAEGQWLNFNSRDISSMWSIALRATWMTLVTTLLGLGAGLIAVRLLTRPLRRLSDAAGAIGQGRRVDIREAGPTDLRDLAHAMNDMQDRIAGLLEDQAKSFEAISHDLRTPLSRQKLAAELVEADDIREVIDASVDEMEAMLRSLQQFLRAQHLDAEVEPVDLGPLLQGLAEPCHDKVRVNVPDAAIAETYREPLTLSLQALIENACRFANEVHVDVERIADDWIIQIADDGPGIPEEHFDHVLAPFVRLDPARGRSTKGFGLGIPTAYRLLTRFGGDLSFHARDEGGLVVRVRVPGRRDATA